MRFVIKVNNTWISLVEQDFHTIRKTSLIAVMIHGTSPLDSKQLHAVHQTKFQFDTDFKKVVLICVKTFPQLSIKKSNTFKHFLQTISHDVDVLNAYELKLDVGVVVFVLISLPCCSICHCIELKKKKQENWMKTSNTDSFRNKAHGLLQ